MSAEPRLPDAVQSIPEALAFWADQTPDDPALIVPGSPAVTYAALWRRARALAEALRDAGIRRESRVVLLLPEGAPLAEALLGTMSAAIAVPFSATLSAYELRAALCDLKAAAALVSPTVAPETRSCCAEIGIPIIEPGENGDPTATTLGDQPTRRTGDVVWPRSQDIAVVRQTSGTTGKPKRVPRTHGSLIDFGRAQRDQFDLRRGDRAPAIAPMTLTLGQTVLMHGIVAGAALICPPPADLARQWATIERERPTWLSVTAGFLELLAQTLRDRPPRPESSSLRFVQVTSAPVSPELCDALARQLGAPILPRFSSSEAGGIAMTLPPPAIPRPGSVGQLIQEVRIVDTAGKRVGAGAAGEIWVRGPKVFSGYLDDPEANAVAFRPGGWFRTGDIGYLDEDGFLYLTGRLNELINRGGEKIAPLDVDRVLVTHPAVAEAAAFAVPDARLGEDIVAAVVLRPGEAVLAWQLRAWLLQRLTPVKVPRRIWMVEHLPRTPTGKVQRGVLAERFRHRL